MLSRRMVRRLRHMRARKDRYNAQHDSEEEEFISLLPDMLEELDKEKKRSKVFRVTDGSIVKSSDEETGREREEEEQLGAEVEGAGRSSEAQRSFLDMLRTPTEVLQRNPSATAQHL